MLVTWDMFPTPLSGMKQPFHQAVTTRCRYHEHRHDVLAKINEAAQPADWGAARQGPELAAPHYPWLNSEAKLSDPHPREKIWLTVSSAQPVPVRP